jgi:branched-chain amino acid transport system ATP-binding protein
MLELTNLVVRYGAIQAVTGVSLHVSKGEVVCLIGANGAGKSTVLNAISGVVSVADGSIKFEGAELRSARAAAIVRSGLIQVPEGRLVFPDMTVQENLEMGAYSRRDNVSQTLDMVLELFPRLAERRAQLAGLMSGGEQQMLAIGRALMAKPRVLLLDEPSMGLAPILVEQIFDIVKAINEGGTTVLLVEQNALMALGIAKRGYILQTGEVVLADTAERLRTDPAVRKAYLGED